MKKIFIQRIDIYDQDVVVAVGMSNAEIVAWLRKHANAKDAKVVIADFEKLGRPDKDSVAFVYDFLGKSILWLGWDWKHRMSNLATLVHETNHLVFNMVHEKGMTRECEAQAYLQAWLFGEISRKLGVKSKTRGERNDRRTTQRKPKRLHRLRPNKKGKRAQTSTSTQNRSDTRRFYETSSRSGNRRG